MNTNDTSPKVSNMQTVNPLNDASKYVNGSTCSGRLSSNAAKSSDFQARNAEPEPSSSGAVSTANNEMSKDEDKKPAAKRPNTRARNGIIKERVEVRQGTKSGTAAGYTQCFVFLLKKDLEILEEHKTTHQRSLFLLDPSCMHLGESVTRPETTWRFALVLPSSPPSTKEARQEHCCAMQIRYWNRFFSPCLFLGLTPTNPSIESFLVTSKIFRVSVVSMTSMLQILFSTNA
jgi:hypothetical protein